MRKAHAWGGVKSLIVMEQTDSICVPIFEKASWTYDLSASLVYGNSNQGFCGTHTGRDQGQRTLIVIKSDMAELSNNQQVKAN